MSLGMTYEQYWYGDVRATRAFAEAHKINLEKQNAAFWRQGMYFYQAIASVASTLTTDPKKGEKPLEYPREPYPVFPKEPTPEEQQLSEEQEALIAEIYMRQMVEAGKNWGKGAQ